MKRILIVTAGFAPVPAVNGGAVETLTTNLLLSNELANEYHFTVCTLGDKKIDESSYVNTEFVQIRVSKFEHFFEKCLNKMFRMMNKKREFFFYNFKLQKKIERLINNREFKFEYVLFENSMDVFDKITKLIGDNCKYLFHLHNEIGGVSKSVEMSTNVAKKSSKILFVSKFLMSNFRQKISVDEKKCSVLYNCVDQNIIASNSDIRERYNIDKEKKVILYVGRINEEKGVLELAKAFSKLRDKNAFLIICGGTWGTEFRNNKYLDEIKFILQNVNDNVFFTGYIDHNNLSDYYKVADIVVIPSICNEAFGMVLVEAALNGKAIIATRSGGMPELLPEDAVMWVEKNEQVVDGLKDAMESLIHDEMKMKTMSMMAQQSVQDCIKFDSKDYFNKFRGILNSIVD